MKECCKNCNFYYEDEIELCDDYIICGFCDKFENRTKEGYHKTVNKNDKCEYFKFS